METLVKIWSAQISLAAQKIWVAQNLRGREVLQPPAPTARTPMGAITCFFNETHYSFSSISYQWDGSAIVPLFKKIKILNTKI